MVERRPHGGHAPDGFLDYSASLNPLGPPEAVRRVIQDHVELTRYPYELREILRTEIADRHGLDPGNVLVGAGTSGLIQLLLQGLPGDDLVVPTPTFTEYEDLGRSLGWSVESVPCHPPVTNQPDFEKIGSSADVVFLCNPNNPSGTSVDPTSLKTLLDRINERNGYLVVDEAYTPFHESPGSLTLSGQVNEHRGLIVLRSFSKFNGVPGLRVGYLLAQKTRVETLRARQNPWPVGEPALRGARQCLRSDAFRRKSRKFITEERKRIKKILDGIPGLRAVESETNFFLFHSRVDELEDRLRERSLVLRDCSTFTGLETGWYRFGIRKRSENDRLLEVLRSVHRTASRV